MKTIIVSVRCEVEDDANSEHLSPKFEQLATQLFCGKYVRTKPVLTYRTVSKQGGEGGAE